MRFLLGVILGLVAVAAWPAEGATDRGGGWDNAWWQEGRLGEVRNFPVETRELSYRSGTVEVPVKVFRPRGRERLPAVLLVHGRRGLDDLIEAHARRLAARGLLVFAPDLYRGRDIAPFPVAHDYVLEDDLDAGLDALLAQPDVRGGKACVLGISRGGYYALKLAVAKRRQDKGLACYVGYYPHLQDPNAPEPAQVYQHAPEIDALTLPTLIFVGADEQYQRKRSIEFSMETLRGKGRPAVLFEYPGVGRGFDFRAPPIRTFADDLAAKDAMQRTDAFVRRHLGP